ncbi:hypothetical protein AVEN_146170-1 [Araneus ventricosus]|uniref:Uncharacterized protein n=1 Tax=Araneus ventricosus TaxID=182803 RepID=A0A4Y2CLU2_ARAVE|nr:hypothetical protein AVEN_146170-1 [Araneus ventricosus]
MGTCRSSHYTVRIWSRGHLEGPPAREEDVKITAEPEIRQREVGGSRWPRDWKVTGVDSVAPKCCCSTYRTHVATCRGAPSCIHTISITTFHCCNSGIAYFCNIVVYRALVMEHVFIPVEVASSKKYGPRTNVLAMPHHTVTLTSCKGDDSTS